MASTTKGRGKRTSKRPSVRSHLRPWARDALGIGLVVLALLAILGLWFGSAGPVGAGLDWLLHATFGIAAVVFPILALFWGLILLRGTAEQDRLRMFIGFAIAAVGVLALISLWEGNPRPFGGYERLSGAAGVIGALASWPLGKLVSGIGVAIVWGGAVLLGLLIFTGTPLSAIWDRIVDAFARGGDDELDEDELDEDEEDEEAEVEVAEP
ncbi:MAG TPA: DNA translocase FtsK 4TM domain-containing protein, partial [Actinomycetota bacterium]|nr:DNA translocase FtsK 4TM domain-containing protein [Actinomycetota bacterium]